MRVTEVDKFVSFGDSRKNVVFMETKFCTFVCACTSSNKNLTNLLPQS